MGQQYLQTSKYTKALFQTTLIQVLDYVVDHRQDASLGGGGGDERGCRMALLSSMLVVQLVLLHPQLNQLATQVIVGGLLFPWLVAQFLQHLQLNQLAAYM